MLRWKALPLAASGNDPQRVAWPPDGDNRNARRPAPDRAGDGGHAGVPVRPQPGLEYSADLLRMRRVGRSTLGAGGLDSGPRGVDGRQSHIREIGVQRAVQRIRHALSDSVAGLAHPHGRQRRERDQVTQIAPEVTAALGEIHAYGRLMHRACLTRRMSDVLENPRAWSGARSSAYEAPCRAITPATPPAERGLPRVDAVARMLGRRRGASSSGARRLRRPARARRCRPGAIPVTGIARGCRRGPYRATAGCRRRSSRWNSSGGE